MAQSRPENLWKEWLHRDDRVRLDGPAHDSCKDLLDSIVTAVHFSGYARWGTTPSKSSLDALGREFTDWLGSSGEWEFLRAAWRADKTGPWSLPLFLTRAYDRFREARYPDSLRGRDIPGGTGRGPDTAAELSSAIHDAFVAITQRLPERCQLSYQLHLEGLLNTEIAALLNLQLGEVEEHIAEAKHCLDENIQGHGT